MTKETAKMTLRPLQARDIFPMSKIIGAIGLDDIKAIFAKDEVRDAMSGKGDVNAVGTELAIDIAGVIIEHLPNVENDLYNLLASLTGSKPKAIAEMPLGDFANLVIDVLQSEGFSDFFKAAQRFTAKAQ